MDAGCHVYLEKPFTLNHPDACKLLAHAEATGKKITVGHTYRFDPPAIALRELIERHMLGEIIHVESFYGYALAGTFGSAILANSRHWVHSLPGKLLQNNVDHVLHKITEFIPDDQPIVRAIGSRRRNVVHGDERDEMLDELRVMVNGVKTSAYGTFSSHARPVGHFVRAYGTANTAHHWQAATRVFSELAVFSRGQQERFSVCEVRLPFFCRYEPTYRHVLREYHQRCTAPDPVSRDTEGLLVDRRDCRAGVADQDGECVG
jgi:predicted dehydrogenase